MRNKLHTPPQDRKRKTRRWLIGLLGTAAVILLLSAATSWLSLQNPYTSADYEGWQEVAVPGMRPFLLPAGWTLTCTADQPEDRQLALTLADENDAVLARGYAFPTGLTTPDITGIASEFAGAPLDEYRLIDEIAVGLGSKAAAYRRGIFFSENRKLLDTYVLEMYDGPAEMHLWFPYCEGEAAAALADRIKAVISSYLD